VVIPSYNGARALPNLVPLLALLLAREGVPVLIHGVNEDPGRVTTREVLEALGLTPAVSAAEALRQLDQSRVSFLPVERLAPSVSALLALRSKLGVRNSAHSLVKMLQPFAAPAIRLVSVTHPEYLVRMREYFTRYDAAALILRGAEGEAVAHPRREPSIDWAYGGIVETWTAEPAQPRDDLPTRDAGATARWIERVLAGEIAVPRAVAHQVDCCRRAAKSIVRDDPR
jgi:anthranilate phosphoribosyltransferase